MSAPIGRRQTPNGKAWRLWPYGSNLGVPESTMSEIGRRLSFKKWC
ncbi:MAG: hypothetical protein QXK62_07030 [Thermoproteus sp.]